MYLIYKSIIVRYTEKVYIYFMYVLCTGCLFYHEPGYNIISESVNDFCKFSFRVTYLYTQFCN